MKFMAKKYRFRYTSVCGRTDERAGGVSRYTLYIWRVNARVCMCVRVCVCVCACACVCVCVYVEAPSVSTGTAHSVSRGVPPGTAELTENFATRGGGEGGAAGPAGRRVEPHSRVPHFQSFAKRSGAILSIRTLAHARD